MTSKKSVLLLEDEINMAYALKVNLEADGYVVVHCTDGNIANKMLDGNYYDILLLDVMVPELDGFEVCKAYRAKDNVTPIIFLSARNDSISRLEGLRAGADDYLTKPFDIDELMLKMDRLIHRTNPRSKHDITYFGDSWIDFTTQEAKGANGEKVKMSKLEYDLARLLITNENKPLSREYIYEAIWNYSADNLPNSRTLDNFIVFLRRYFEPDPANPQYFLSVRGVGYKFKKSV